VADTHFYGVLTLALIQIDLARDAGFAAVAHLYGRLCGSEALREWGAGFGEETLIYMWRHEFVWGWCCRRSFVWDVDAVLSYKSILLGTLDCLSTFVLLWTLVLLRGACLYEASTLVSHGK
jgi:hypothetical protein